MSSASTRCGVEVDHNGRTRAANAGEFVTRPGMVWGGSPEQQVALAKKVVPMGRVTKAEDVAGAILCFASDLTGYSTGQ